MHHKTLITACLLTTTLGFAQDDIREKFGTRTLPPAMAIQRGIDLEKAGKAKEALAAFDQAIASEPDKRYAHYRRAIILRELGQVEECIKAWELAYSLPSPGYEANVIAASACNLGLLYAQMDNYGSAELWLSRTVLADPKNESKNLGMAYRSLVLTAIKRQDFLSATIRGNLGESAVPNSIEKDMLAHAVSQVGAHHEVARVLRLELPPCEPAMPQRELATRLTKVESAGEPLTDPISDLLPHGNGSSVIALSRGKPYYYLVRCSPSPTWTKITTESPVLVGTVVGDELYLALSQPLRIARLRLENGIRLAEYPIPSPAPYSIAALPKQNRLYLSGHPCLRILDLTDGRCLDTDYLSLQVRTDTEHDVLYSYYREEPVDRTMTVLIGGRPIIFEPHQAMSDIKQTMLMQFKQTPEGLLLPSAVHLAAAAYGTHLAVSPDGRWVAVAGLGGWYSSQAPRKGSGIAVFGADNFAHVQGFFATDELDRIRGQGRQVAQPTGLAFNGVTQQFAALTRSEALVYHLSDEKTVFDVIGEKLNGACAWSADGAWLILGQDGGGLAFYANDLTDAELQRPSLNQLASSGRGNTSLEMHAEPVLAALQNFTPSADEEIARGLVKQALLAGRPERPVTWYLLSEHAQALKARGDIYKSISPEEAGLRAHRLREALQQSPHSPPLLQGLAENLRRVHQPEEAEASAIEVVHSDAGRTNLSVLALRTLGETRQESGDDIAAIHCFAAALLADRDNPLVREALRTLVAARKWDDLLASLTLTGTGALQPSAVQQLALIEPPSDSKEPLTGAQVYEQAARATVRIETAQGSGSGFCVTRQGHFLTNAHVVGLSDTVTVRFFELRDGRLIPGPVLPGKVILRLDADDLAVVEVSNAPLLLGVLPLARRTSAVGTRIYAIGNPALGERVLDQTFTEGLISAVDRIIDGIPYLQHSAAVHPGSSGGPLVDEQGVVVGMITLKAGLQDVGFALPANRLRENLETHRK